MLQRVIPIAMILAALLRCAQPAQAQLKDGVSAPAFSAAAARGGSVVTFDLRSALTKGRVVLYFFPKAFTSGCTVEAHAFSDRIAEFTKLGATVIGVSADTIETQKRFSTQECRSKFLVQAIPGSRSQKPTMRSYSVSSPIERPT